MIRFYVCVYIAPVDRADGIDSGESSAGYKHYRKSIDTFSTFKIFVL